MNAAQSINVGDIRNFGGNIAIGSNITISVTNVAELLRCFEPITPALIDDKTRQYFHIWDMAEPEWPFFDRNWNKAEDVPRKLYFDLFTRITNPPNPHLNYLQLLLGENGSGKTTLLMRLAADLCRQEGFGVLWLRPTATEEAASFMPQVREVALQLGRGRKLFVLIDDILSVTKAALFLRELRIVQGEPAQLIVVGSGEAGQLEDTFTSPADIHRQLASFAAPGAAADLAVAPFDDDELRQLAVVLANNQHLYTRLPQPLVWGNSVLATLGQPLTPPLAADGYSTMYQPRQAMSLLTQGQPVKERVAQQISAIQGSGDISQPQQRSAMVRLYDEVILLHRTGTAASRAWLEAAAQRDPQLKSALDALTSGQFQAPTLMQVQADGSVVAAHRLDAQAAYEVLHPAEGDKRQAYAGLLGVAPLGVQGDALKLLHGMLGSSVAPAYGQNVALVQGVLADSAGKVQQMIAAANPYQLGSGWASVFRRIGDLPQALQLGTQAINGGGLAQDIGPAYYNRAIAHQQAGHAAEAAHDFAEAGRIAALPPNTYIPPLQVAPPPENPVAPPPAVPLIAWLFLSLMAIVVLVLGAAIWGMVQATATNNMTPTPLLEPSNTVVAIAVEPTNTNVATLTLPPTFTLTNTPLPTATPTDTPIPVNPNVILLKQAVADMQSATSYSVEYNQVSNDQNTTIFGDLDVANAAMHLRYSGSGWQNNITDVVVVKGVVYLSSDGGQSYFVSPSGNLPTGTPDFDSIWASFPSGRIDQVGYELKDGDPAIFPIDGVDTKHIVAPAEMIIDIQGTLLGNFAQPDFIAEFWIVPDAAPTMRQLHIHTTAGGSQSINIRWSKINEPIIIAAPPVAVPTDTPVSPTNTPTSTSTPMPTHAPENFVGRWRNDDDAKDKLGLEYITIDYRNQTMFASYFCKNLPVTTKVAYKGEPLQLDFPQVGSCPVRSISLTINDKGNQLDAFEVVAGYLCVPQLTGGERCEPGFIPHQYTLYREIIKLAYNYTPAG